MFDEIRFKGNAYGGGCRYDNLIQTLTFYSYRDPHISRTLDVFKNVANYVKNADWLQEDIERSIITTTQKDSPVLRPAKATTLSLDRYLTGKTTVLREQYYEQMLTGTVKNVKEAFLEVLEKAQDHYAICVMSSREKLEQENQILGDQALIIHDI
jgi:Zn-dependent M16 (insulinase) family peptidase